MSDCGCGVVQAKGDPHGRSISSLGGLGRKRKKSTTCKRVRQLDGTTKRVCSSAKPKKPTKRSKRRK